MSNETTTEVTTEETSTTSVPQQSETDVTTQDSQVTSDETTETTTQDQQQPSLNDLQAQVKRMETALKKANAEAKTHRLEANELKKFKEQVEAEKLTETQKQELARQNLEKQLADAKKQYDDSVIERQQLRVKHSVQLQAARLNIDTDVAEKLLDWSAIEYDDDGTPNNVTTLLNDLVKSKPYLVKSNGRQAPTSGGATNPPRSTTNGNTVPDKITWEYITQVQSDPKAYNALPVSERKRITQWMAQNTRR